MLRKIFARITYIPHKIAASFTRQKGIVVAISLLLVGSLYMGLNMRIGNKSAAAAAPPTVTISENTPLHPVPSQYIGFSIDPANLCYVVSLAQNDPSFVQLLKNIGPGTFRVGGNTGDTHATWSTTATQPNCVWNNLVMTPSLVSQFFAFAQSIGYQVMWQVPLNNNQPAQDAAEAAYVATMPGLYSVEIGNEPNYYKYASTQYQTTINRWNTIYQDYIADGGKAPVTGPAATVSAKFYMTPFLNQQATKLKAVTGHWYVGSALKNPTCTSLLSSTGSVMTASGVSQANAHHLPFIMNETNTYTHYGMPGVSNAFCSALWAASYSLNGLKNGVQGMYFHGVADYPLGNSAGVNQVYTPINEDGTPAPQYYGLLFYYQMAQAAGNQVAATATNTTNVDAFAVRGNDNNLRVALINRSATAQSITVNTANPYTQANRIDLTAPSLTSLSDVTFGGAAVGADGTWTPTLQPLTVTNTSASINVPAYSATVVTYTPAAASTSPTP